VGVKLLGRTQARTCKGWKQTPEQYMYGQAWINLPTMRVGSAPGTVAAPPRHPWTLDPPPGSRNSRSTGVRWDFPAQVRPPPRAGGAEAVDPRAQVAADLASLGGQIPTAVKYAWGGTNCCACGMAPCPRLCRVRNDAFWLSSKLPTARHSVLTCATPDAMHPQQTC
jgi:hypothetical protein